MIVLQRNGVVVFLRGNFTYPSDTLNLKTKIKRTMSGKHYGYLNAPATRRYSIKLEHICNDEHLYLRRFIRTVSHGAFYYFTGEMDEDDNPIRYVVRLINHPVTFDYIKDGYWSSQLELETLA